MIVRHGSQWRVVSEKGRNLGTYSTKSEAERRLRQVEYFKHAKRPGLTTAQGVLVALGAILIALVVWYAMTAPQPSVPGPAPVPAPGPGDDQVVCTMDAMQCPDGSFVGRVPPSCAFAPCP